MVQLSNLVTAAATAAFMGANVVLSHPGHDVKAEYAQRHAALHAMPLEKKSLARCAEKLKARGHEAKLKARREAMVENLRQKRSIERRDFLRARDVESALATDHHSNLTGITADTDPSTLFGTNNSCVLSPEVTEGPYYVTGEYVRQDVTEDQAGVSLTIDIQIIDTNTCEPLPDVLVDFWHCNSTGVYSGIVASGNGNSNDATNVNNTFLRGIQRSDSDGILTFDTLFPGWYTGRAPHVHILSHQDAEVQSNDTITGGTVSHVGQIFFDQDLISLVGEEEPYASNTQPLTENSEDSILAEEAGTIDPFIEYVLLGDSVADGLFGWISFGIDSTNSKSVQAAANYGENGGVQNANSGAPGGGPPGGNSTIPSGAPPSGAPSGTSPLVTVTPSASESPVATPTSQVTTSLFAHVSALSDSAVGPSFASSGPHGAPSGVPHAPVGGQNGAPSGRPGRGQRPQNGVGRGEDQAQGGRA